MEEGFEVVNLHGCASGVIATPTIGKNVNWYIGNKDTGVCAKGADGEIGPVGTRGEKGEEGDKGDQGEKGEKGDQGPKGEDADSSELERLSDAVDTLNQSLKHDQYTFSNIAVTAGNGALAYTIPSMSGYRISQVTTIIGNFTGATYIIPKVLVNQVQLLNTGGSTFVANGTVNVDYVKE